MAIPTLGETQLLNGTWQGIVETTKTTAPHIDVYHLDTPITKVVVAPTDIAGRWAVSVPIPKSAITEGVQSFIVCDAQTGTKLGDFTLLAGDVVGHDIRVELQLLRAELDMLKRAFRRHCVETT